MYGLPYMGSKSAIATDIINFLPSGKRLVDLFGGGGAITHCACLSGKWNKFLYNDYNRNIVDLFVDAINGEFNPNVFKPKFITKKRYLELKPVNSYIKYVWSFGNNPANGYLYGKDRVPFMKAGHKLVVFNDIESKQWLKEYYKDSYYWLFDYVYNEDIHISRINYTNLVLKLEAIKCCVEYGDKRVYDLYKDYSFEDFKKVTNDEITARINEYIPDIPKKMNYRDKDTKLQRLEQLRDLNQYQILITIQALEKIQAIESLADYDIRIMNKSYIEYNYKKGDVVYCDIPYENTTKYVKQEFNHKEFYDWAYSRDYQVYFSSYEISDDRFYKVWTRQKLMILNNKHKNYKNETIYTNKLNYYGQLQLL